MVKRRLRRGGCVAWRQVARTVASTDADFVSNLAALIGRQAVLRIPRAVVVSLACAVGATLTVFDSGATSPAIEAPMEGEQGLPVVCVELASAPGNKSYSIYKTSLSSLNTLRTIQAHLINNMLYIHYETYTA